jgi:hypothetical protein
MKIIYLFSVIEKFKDLLQTDQKRLEKTRNKYDSRFIQGKILARKADINILENNTRDE